jgi:hypothetical protein
MIYALEMAIACAIRYWIITYGLAPFVDKASDFVGGMWAVVATVFVFRDSRAKTACPQKLEVVVNPFARASWKALRNRRLVAWIRSHLLMI